LSRPRVLIEDWLPAAAIGVECIRGRSTGQQPPDKRLRVWWARRPLTVSRAAVPGSLLPADFPHAFEKLLGFWGSSGRLLEAQSLLDWARKAKCKIENPHGTRAFRAYVAHDLLDRAHTAASKLWGDHGVAPSHCYIFARTVPAPNPPHPHTPLVPDWHLLKPKSGKLIVAEPIVDQKNKVWSVRVRELGTGVVDGASARAARRSSGRVPSIQFG